MEKREIKQLIYIVTTRCNYRCKQCSSNIYDTKENKKEQEISCYKIIEAIKNSNMLKQIKSISITGGEPFLKDDLVEFILELEKLGIKCDITTNGSQTNRIKELVNNIKSPENLSFAISIDGIDETHNTIRDCTNGYEKALKAIEIIKKRDINVAINTVMQQLNYKELNPMNEIFKQMGYYQNYIPMLSCETIPFSYSDEEVQKILSFVQNKWDKKYLLTKGKFKITNCHAINSSCVINPYGEVYACLTGYVYLNDRRYYIGDIKQNNLDYILNSVETSEVYEDVVSKCSGCYNSCEVVREVIYHDLDCTIDKQDFKTAINLITDKNNLDFLAINLDDWHNLEECEEGSYRWMAKKNAKVFLKSLKENPKAIEFKYMNGLPLDNHESISLKVKINNIVIKELACKAGINIEKIYIPIDIRKNEVVEISFEINKIWNPSKIYGSNDTRKLGIAIFNVCFLYEDYFIIQKRLEKENVELEIMYNGNEKLSVATSDKIQIPITVKNKGNEKLVSLPPYPIYLSYHWVDEKGNMEIFDGIRTSIDYPLLTDEKREFKIDVLAPKETGCYKLQITLVQEYCFWFEEVLSNLPYEIEVEVKPKEDVI